MKRKFNCLLFLFFPLLAFANRGEAFKRTEVKVFTVSNGAQFTVSNKYGQVVFHVWNKNEVKATVTITGFGKTDAEAESVVSGVTINAENSPTAVSLKSVYTPKGGRWFQWGGNSSKDYVSIDYDIYIPQSLSGVVAENSFGDIIADKLPCPAKISLSYGNFDIRDAEDITMSASYCNKGKFGNAGMVTLSSNYSNVKAENLRGLTVTSNYSNLEIGSSEKTTITSKYDNYKIGSAGALTFKGAFSDFSLENLKESIEATFSYGDLKIKKVSSGFKSGRLSFSYGDARMNFVRKQPLRVDVAFSYGDFNTGDMEMKSVESIHKNTSMSYKGFANGGNSQSPLLEAYGKNGDLSINTY
ncbi:hypothetical protein [Chitinophaga sp. Cy-1792]|uniref:hypothetical protein n=1 Tax=Chitinophaga sp. Cy-1792 TaxID=2608339 RepID=UPI00141D8E91|nr:hypothetical protein [Chitinophaga sp. Cy-1792]NIG57714.1 hypothetical protein [Chitinophaga sp. Cy-1792]